MYERLIDRVVRKPAWHAGSADIEPLITREWLVTNGLGGYASGTVAGMITRRYHGMLVAALPNPIGRMVMLNHLIEHVTLPDGTRTALSGEEYAAGRLEAGGAGHLTEFRLEAGLPAWRFRVGDATIEKRVVMPHRQNTVIVTYTLVQGSGPVRLTLRPALHFRGYESPVTAPSHDHYRLSIEDGHYTITSERTELPPLRIQLEGDGAACSLDAVLMNELVYRVEEARGYEYKGALWSPGSFALEIASGASASLIASTEPPEVMAALGAREALQREHERRRRLLDLAPAALRDEVAAELVLAADQFLISPAGRRRDHVRAQAIGDEVRTVIAGYHWFTDWGRDTMISLEGLTLSTGRHREAGFILRTFAQYVRDGLIPNMFPDGANEGLYHTADATLWFFHALDRYVTVTGDRTTLRHLLPTMCGIADHHINGTRFGIGVDPADGLLRQGAEGYQLTWMDAKMDDWVVTPRRGKAVEINALWYNALCVLEGWLRTERAGDAAAERYVQAAERARRSFNDRFWYADGGYLYDVVDGPNGDSAEFRPNQLFAISLPHAVLQQSRWAPVVEAVERRLVTPYGLRSLAPDSPDYKPRYWGDLRTRDAAYHQGTVWGWLIGPWVDAWRKVHPEDADARRWLGALVDHLDEFGVGSVAEIFDAEPPYTPRGCIAQAWSVAEVLRCWLLTAAPVSPPAASPERATDVVAGGKR